MKESISKSLSSKLDSKEDGKQTVRLPFVSVPEDVEIIHEINRSMNHVMSHEDLHQFGNDDDAALEYDKDRIGLMSPNVNVKARVVREESK